MSSLGHHVLLYDLTVFRSVSDPDVRSAFSCLPQCYSNSMQGMFLTNTTAKKVQKWSQFWERTKELCRASCGFHSSASKLRSHCSGPTASRKVMTYWKKWLLFGRQDTLSCISPPPPQSLITVSISSLKWVKMKERTSFGSPGNPQPRSFFSSEAGTESSSPELSWI